MRIKDHLLWLWNLWPPFFFSGIKIEKMTKDFRQIDVRLKLRFWNSNFFGTQYGGLIFSMTDPFYMIMLIKNLSKNYVIWDKAAHIKYIRQGRTDLIAKFYLTDEDLSQIDAMLQEQDKFDWTRTIEVKDIHGELVAEVHKVVSIKKRTDVSKHQT